MSARAQESDRAPERAVRVFNGRYTVTSPTGAHRTFEISTQPEGASFAPGKRIVSLLEGPDNNLDYRGFGFINDHGVTVWRSKRGEPGAPSMFETYARVLWSLTTEGEASPWVARGMGVLIEGRCCRCNRALTDPTSILTGIGPTCAGRE